MIPIAAFYGIFEYSSNNIQIFEPKIFKYSYSVHLIITNIFVFVFSPEFDPEYISIRIRVQKNLPNIFVFVFGTKKYSLRSELHLCFIQVASMFHLSYISAKLHPCFIQVASVFHPSCIRVSSKLHRCFIQVESVFHPS